MTRAIFDNIHIDTEIAERTAQSIQTPCLQPVACVFARNVKELLSLLVMPFLLLMAGTSRGHHLFFHICALFSTNNVFKWRTSEVARREVEAEARRLAEAARQDPKSGFRPVDEALEQLPRLVEELKLEAPARALLYAACASAWSYLECVAKDTWIAALNSRPSELAQPAMGRLPDEPQVEGLAGRQLSVGLIARYGFDLRANLGTLLSAKFDFTSVSGIRAAYEAAFGKSAALGDLLVAPELSRLEATRHLVVHRAGLVDEEYVRRTGETLTIGAQLSLTGARFSELANSAVHAGAGLLQLVDGWMIRNPPSESV